MQLLNGHTERRVQSSDGCTVLPCGCFWFTHKDIQTYGGMCDAHHGEWSALHVAANQSHRSED